MPANEPQTAIAPESAPAQGSSAQTQLVSELVDLTRAECVELLATKRFGRLAVALCDGAPLIRPVNYQFDAPSQSVVFRTCAGSKLHAVLHAREAAFEIDGVDEHSGTGWSVIIHGVPEQVTNPIEVRHLDALGVTPWGPGEKRHWVRIRVRMVTGRRILASR
jgi:nitroimidazol reductase NimA-like FMN-containing flavoprotein (pyridoxamine 5'-phosphate oxidase superfamily)